MQLILRILLFLLWIGIIVIIYRKNKTRRYFDHLITLFIVLYIARIVEYFFLKNATVNIIVNGAILLVSVILIYLMHTRKAFIDKK